MMAAILADKFDVFQWVMKRVIPTLEDKVVALLCLKEQSSEIFRSLEQRGRLQLSDNERELWCNIALLNGNIDGFRCVFDSGPCRLSGDHIQISILLGILRQPRSSGTQIVEFFEYLFSRELLIKEEVRKRWESHYFDNESLAFLAAEIPLMSYLESLGAEFDGLRLLTACIAVGRVEGLRGLLLKFPALTKTSVKVHDWPPLISVVEDFDMVKAYLTFSPSTDPISDLQEYLGLLAKSGNIKVMDLLYSKRSEMFNVNKIAASIFPKYKPDKEYSLDGLQWLVDHGLQLDRKDWFLYGLERGFPVSFFEWLLRYLPAPHYFENKARLSFHYSKDERDAIVGLLKHCEIII